MLRIKRKLRKVRYQDHIQVIVGVCDDDVTHLDGYEAEIPELRTAEVVFNTDDPNVLRLEGDELDRVLLRHIGRQIASQGLRASPQRLEIT